MAGVKTNERPRGAVGDESGPEGQQPGTRAVHRHARISPYKVREVLDLIRDRPVSEAIEILRFSERDAALVVGKVLNSAVANAEHNDELDPDELYVSACFADEGTTIKRWRPRARGRATRIRKRTSHITVIVARLPEDRLARMVARRRAELAAQRARRVAGARRGAAAEGDTRSRSERRQRRWAATEELDETEETEELDETEDREGSEDGEESEPTDEAAEDETADAGDETETDDTDAETDEAAEAETDDTETDDTETDDTENDTAADAGDTEPPTSSTKPAKPKTEATDDEEGE